MKPKPKYRFGYRLSRDAYNAYVEYRPSLVIDCDVYVFIEENTRRARARTVDDFWGL